MNKLILGNILCFIASIIMTLMGLIKRKKRFILSQCGMNILFISGKMLLGGISGAIANLITLSRNIMLLRFKINTAIKILFILLQITLTLLTGSSSLLNWLPVIGGCLLTWFVDTDNMILFKFVVVTSQVLWAIYDFSINNFATVPFDISAAITNTISIISLYKDKNKNRQTQI